MELLSGVPRKLFELRKYCITVYLIILADCLKLRDGVVFTQAEPHVLLLVPWTT